MITLDAYDAHVIAYHIHVIVSNRAIKRLRALLATMECVS